MESKTLSHWTWSVATYVTADQLVDALFQGGDGWEGEPGKNGDERGAHWDDYYTGSRWQHQIVGGAMQFHLT